MDSTITSLLITYGPLGAMAVLFVLGLIVPKSVVTDKNKEIAELKQALKESRQALGASTTAAETTRDILAAIQLGHQIGHERETDRGGGP